MRKRHPAAGFTLIELMVVLGILGLLLALVPGTLSVAIPGQQLRAASYQLADDLRDARARAVLSGEATSLSIGLDASGEHLGRSGSRLPRGTTIALEDAPRGSGAEEMRFFPDGSASGGTIKLAAGGRTYAITVDWLTGRVVVDE